MPHRDFVIHSDDLLAGDTRLSWQSNPDPALLYSDSSLETAIEPTPKFQKLLEQYVEQLVNEYLIRYVHPECTNPVIILD